MKNISVVLYVLLIFISSCKKEDNYNYGIQDVTVKQTGSDKKNLKSTTEFISIAYADLFSASISQSDLLKLNMVYDAFGGKKLIEDRIIRNFLNNSTVNIPSAITADTSLFIINTYKKLYNREPNAFEKYYLNQQLRLNNAINPLVVYYSLMTSDEYRYY